MSTFEKSHLYECDCITCSDAIKQGMDVPGRRTVRKSMYRSVTRITVPINAPKRKSWIEITDNPE